MMEKQLSEITRKEWIMYQWLETGAMDEKGRMFIRGPRKTPAESFEAAEEWDFLEAIEAEEE